MIRNIASLRPSSLVLSSHQNCGDVCDGTSSSNRSTDESLSLYLHGNQVVSDVQVTQFKTSDVS